MGPSRSVRYRSPLLLLGGLRQQRTEWAGRVTRAPTTAQLTAQRRAAQLRTAMGTTCAWHQQEAGDGRHSCCVRVARHCWESSRKEQQLEGPPGALGWLTRQDSRPQHMARVSLTPGGRVAPALGGRPHRQVQELTLGTQVVHGWAR